MSIVIPKLNKSLYDSPKAFFLLNILGKLIEKIIREMLQAISSDFIYSNQVRGLK